MFPVYVSSMFVIGFLRRGWQNECACTALMVNSSHFKMSSINSIYFFFTHIINLCVTSPHLWQTVLTCVATLKAEGIHIPEFIKVKITATWFLGVFQIKSESINWPARSCQNISTLSQSTYPWDEVLKTRSKKTNKLQELEWEQWLYLPTLMTRFVNKRCALHDYDAHIWL